MAQIRGADTKPEIRLRLRLFRMGFRYRLHDSRLPGRPDLVLARYNAVIFVNGCFWHRHVGCKYTTVPKNNHTFWIDKFRSTIERDQRQLRQLRTAGWRVAIVWGCALRHDADTTARAVGEWLKGEAGTLVVGDPVR